MHAVGTAYESIFHQLAFRRYKETSTDFVVGLHLGIQDLYVALSDAIDDLAPPRRKSPFISQPTESKYDLVSDIASVVYGSLEAIANRFVGPDARSRQEEDGGNCAPHCPELSTMQ